MTMVVRIVVWLLEKGNLSTKDRLILTNAVLDKQFALPLRDILTVAEGGTILFQGRPLSYELATVWRQSAKALLDNPVRKLLRDQVAFKAITTVVHKLETPEQAIFGKAALWWGQTEEQLATLLAGTSPEQED